MPRITTGQIIEDILRAEGSRYTNHSADRGGPTKYGITLNALRAWRGQATIEDVKTLTRSEAIEIYAKRYIEDPLFDQISDTPLRAMMVDMGVLHGPRLATMWLQKAIGTADDGKIGSITLGKLAEVDQAALLLNLIGVRCRFMAHLAQQDANKVNAGTLPASKSNALFVEGWINRATVWLG